jgi:hypothetical protein
MKRRYRVIRNFKVKTWITGQSTIIKYKFVLIVVIVAKRGEYNKYKSDKE